MKPALMQCLPVWGSFNDVLSQRSMLSETRKKVSQVNDPEKEDAMVERALGAANRAKKKEEMYLRKSKTLQANAKAELVKAASDKVRARIKAAAYNVGGKDWAKRGPSHLSKKKGTFFRA